MPAAPNRHALIHGLFVTDVERLTLRGAAVVLVDLRLVGAVGLTNQELPRDPFTGRAAAIHLDAEALGRTDFL
ncbi:hypothetical protein D9M70_537300 [compost metagenome]